MDLNKVNIVMKRENLDDMPVWDIQAGFTFRDYREGDMDTWIEIQSFCDTNTKFGEQKFISSFNNRLDLLPGRMAFICDDKGKAIATSTAWYENEQAGLVHWVAVVPQYQGKGLAKPLLSHTLHKFTEFGCTSAMLRTQIFRIPAINLYLKAGFVPVINSQVDVDCWQAVNEKFRTNRLNGNVIDSILV